MKRWTITTLIAIAAAIGLSACTPGEPEATAAREPSVLNRSIGPEPGSVDPQVARTTQAHVVIQDLFEGLMSYSPAGELVGGAAERWHVSDDGLEYRFQIRDNARWSNAEPVTADDFVFSFRRLVDPTTAAFYATHLSVIANADAIVAGELSPDTLGVRSNGPRELVVTLTQPTAHFLQLLAQPPAFPVNERSLIEHDERFARPGILVSNGAYTFEEWTLGSVMRLERNSEHWDTSNTSIDVVRYHVAADPANELKRYLAGELDITSTIPSAAFQRLKTERPGDMRVASTLTLYYYGFNLNQPKLRDNPKLREALSLAINREDLAEKVLGRGEAPAYSVVAPGTSNYAPPRLAFASLSVDEREQRARELYQDAGYSEERPLEIELRYNSGDTHQRLALAVQQMWRDTLGFEAELINEEFRVLVANVIAKEVTQVFRLSWKADYNDAYSFLGIFESDSPSNVFSWENAAFDALLDRANAQVDLAERRRLLEDAERIVLAEHPMIPLYFFVSHHLVRPTVSGWQDNILDTHYSRHLSIDALR